MNAQRPNKRLKLDEQLVDPALVRNQRAAFLSSMSRDVSPPLSSRATPEVEVLGVETVQSAKDTAPTKFPSTSKPVVQPTSDEPLTRGPSLVDGDGKLDHGRSANTTSNIVPSPFTLTKIRDLKPARNTDTVNLHEILGNPLIREAWVFNYCFDVDWMMQFFDPDVRDFVQVKIIHGSWRNEDSNRRGIEDACRRWANVENFKAYLPDQFGTHHSKMFVLFTHDDQAEVVIHTANMLMKDWTNMTQAVWRTGLLPLFKLRHNEQIGPIGSGPRFKHDLLAYLKEYKKPTQFLHRQLQNYDFSSVRGALVASVPSKFNNSQTASTEGQHLWGYPLLRETLTNINKSTPSPSTTATPHLAAQVSSIASLPATWLQNFVSATASSPRNPPSLSIIFPTPTNVAESLDGYASGGSIHMKAQSATHINQINSLRQHLCQWAKGDVEGLRAGRHEAAPHIKTYVQYNMQPTKKALQDMSRGVGGLEIDWALLTSANLSVQAWGSLPRKSPGTKPRAKGPRDASGTPSHSEDGTVHIQSFEIGVLVWPGLYLEDFGGDQDQDEGDSLATVQEREGKGQLKTKTALKAKTMTSTKARMIPVFGSNIPTPTTTPKPSSTSNHNAVSPSTRAQSSSQSIPSSFASQNQSTLSKTQHPNGKQMSESDSNSKHEPSNTNSTTNTTSNVTTKTTIGLRIPYSLPLTPYQQGEMPWSPQGRYMRPDWRGGVWNGGG